MVMTTKPGINYGLLAMHIFKYPDREMCLAEWDKIFYSAPYHREGRQQIISFFNSVVNAEINRLNYKN
jgi:hypothetical protein